MKRYEKKDKFRITFFVLLRQSNEASVTQLSRETFWVDTGSAT